MYNLSIFFSVFLSFSILHAEPSIHHDPVLSVKAEPESRKQLATEDRGFLIMGKNVRQTFEIQKYFKERGSKIVGADEGTPLFVYSSDMALEDMRMSLSKRFDLKDFTVKKATTKDIFWRKNIEKASQALDFTKSRGTLILEDDSDMRADIRDFLHKNGFITMGLVPDHILVLPERDIADMKAMIKKAGFKPDRVEKRDFNFFFGK